MKEKWYPLSAPQYNLWMDEQQNPGSFLNVIHAAAVIRQKIDEDRLNLAVNEVVRRSDSLRLHIGVHEGEVGQYADEYVPFSCPVLDFSENPDEADQWLKLQARRGFLLDGQKLWEITIVRMPGEKHLLDARVHHIISDGFNFGLLYQKIFDAYLKLEKEEPLGEEEPSYLEFALRDSRYAGSRQEEEDRAFWKEYMKDVPPAPQFRPDFEKGKPEVQREVLPLGGALSQEVLSFAAQNGVTPFHVLHAALAACLSRCCQTEDVVTVTPRLNRDTEEERRTLGEFTVAVPVRLHVPQDKGFLQLCRDSRENNRLCAAHKKYGYSAILDDLRRGGEQGVPSHFTLSFQQTSLKTGLDAGISLMESVVLQNHLTMTVEQWNGGGFSLMYDYFGSFYGQGELRDFHAVFCRLLQEGIRSPESPVSGLSVLPEEQEQRLEKLNSRSMPYDRSQTIVSLFQAQAGKTPDKIAVIGTDGTLTFREADQISNRLAHALLKRGVQKENLIAFMLPRTTMLVCCMLGILKSGGAFVPIDHQYPAKRIEHILGDSQAKFLVSTPELAGALGVDCLEIGELLRETDDSRVSVDLSPDNLAYCIYTSGSTGKPKGVLIEHHGINNFTRPENNPFNEDICKNGRGIVAIGSICFDISLFEIFVTMLNGMFVVLASENQLADPQALARLMEESGANIMHCTPSRLLSYLSDADFQKAVGGLDVILSAGEAFPASLSGKIKQLHPQTRVYNGYGPTEATIGATIGMPDEIVTIGEPVANVQVYLLDRNGQMLPEGCVGEICIGGDGVGRGYCNRPDLTAERFTMFRGKRIYHTGDIGCWNRQGQLMFFGRNDNQIKLRGLRIELPEIENCLGTYPGVLQTAAVVREQHLCCFYTASSKLDASVLKSYLAEYLTAYMVPEFLVQLDAMPMTPGGKTDKKALEEYPLETEALYVPPETEREKILCEVFSQVLGREPVGACDNFFETGGTSLLAARLMLLARKENILFTYSDVFRNPTPRMLAAVKEKQEESETNPLDDYDYSGINRILQRNRSFAPGPGPNLGDILLTGATGYLGIHMLHALLKAPDVDGKIYCLVRDKEKMSAEKRLKSMLFYYFEESFSDRFGTDLFVVEGDLSQPKVLENDRLGSEIGTVINCAADVAHFAYGNKLEKVNVEGVERLIAFCEKRNCTFVQVSTMSVGGVCTPAQRDAGMCLKEDRLFFGQRISNDYINTKFLAERLTLEAAVRGLPVRIMRVGNLQGRASDGEFQMNLKGNAFTKLLQCYVRIGKAPMSLRGRMVQFSPVDQTVEAILSLLAVPDRYTVFHTYDSNGAAFDDIFRVLKNSGYEVKYVPDAEFEADVDRLSRTDEGREAVEGLLLDKTGSSLVETPVSNEFTGQALAARGFSWGEIGSDYLERYITALQTLGFFDE